MRYRKERLAMYFGWIGFVLIIVGIFLPWGTYGTYGTRWISGLTWAYGFYLLVGCVIIIPSILGLMMKAYKVAIVFLGVGGLMIIFGAGLFISSYYEKYPYISPFIQDISFGSFITLIGGILELLAAFLYTQHVRTQAAS